MTEDILETNPLIQDAELGVSAEPETAIENIAVPEEVPGYAAQQLIDQQPRSNSLLDKGRALIAKSVTRPKNVTAFNTRDLNSETSFFHFLVYSDTNMRKTTTAARFGDPLETLIILTRAGEQMIPLRDDGYEILQVVDGAGLRYGIMNPEGEWEIRRKERPELRDLKYVCVDDITEGVSMLLEDYESKDMRKNYGDAGKELKELLRSLRRKPIHVGMVALAKMKENTITNKDKIGPDLPPSMLGMLGTDVEFAFYIMPETYNLLTDRSWETFTEVGDDGKQKAYKVEIFAKSKLPLSLIGQVPPVVAKMEKPDLRALWSRIQNASKVAAVVTTKERSLSVGTAVGNNPHAAPRRFGVKK